MIVNKIEFEGFRNIEKESIEFKNGINVIYGENAQGKTNILEGIYLFARGKSFRAFKDKELVECLNPNARKGRLYRLSDEGLDILDKVK